MPWVKELNNGSIERVAACQVGTFVAITVQTGKRQIVRVRAPTVLARNDVINMEREWIGIDRKMTVLASMISSRAPLGLGRHSRSGFRRGCNAERQPSLGLHHG